MRARLIGGLVLVSLLAGLATPVSVGDGAVVPDGGFDGSLDGGGSGGSGSESQSRSQAAGGNDPSPHEPGTGPGPHADAFGEATCPGGPTDETRAVTAELESATEFDTDTGTDLPPRIVELYPNPTTDENVGEFVVVGVPDRTVLEDGNWSLTDGHTTARLPADAGSGRVAYSLAPEETASMTSHPVRELEGHLRLAADGDELTLRNGDEVVDRIAYDRAPEGERWYRVDADGGGSDSVGNGADVDASVASSEPPATGRWWPRGATCLEALTADADAVTAFTLPDAPEVPLETFAAADDRIALAGYTVTSEAVADELRAATERGVEVEVLVESGPVGGTPDRTAAVLDELEDAGATVRVLGGSGARYRYQHAKYAVVDDRALVTTENWKPSGIGGTSSRGWGVVVDDETVASHLESVFRTDFEGRDTTPWADHRRTATFVETEPAGERFTGRIDPETVPVDSVDVLLAPDNVESELREQLRSAEDSILVEQVRIGSREQPLLQETLEAARRGVEVRILLDASWYVEDENRALVRWLERTADEEDLPLEARLVEPRNRFEKIHAKGIVIDEETAVVGSANWNNNSLRENREVVVVLHGDEVGSFYAAVFEADWDGGRWTLPIGLVVVLAVALVVAGLVGRRYVRFDEAGDRSLEFGGVGFDPDSDGEPDQRTPADETGRETTLEAATDGEPSGGTDESESEAETESESGSARDGVLESERERESEREGESESENESKSDFEFEFVSPSELESGFESE